MWYRELAAARWMALYRNAGFLKERLDRYTNNRSASVPRVKQLRERSRIAERLCRIYRVALKLKEKRDG